MLDALNLKDDKFILTHSSRGVSPWSADSREDTTQWKGMEKKAASFIAAGKQNTEERARSVAPKSYLSDPPRLSNVL